MKTPLSRSAISETASASTGYLGDGHDLLNNLRGNNGALIQSVAVGYVMAHYDSQRSCGTTVRGADSRLAVTCEQVVHTVESWLEAHPARRVEPAAALIGAALEQLAPSLKSSTGPRRLVVNFSRRIRQIALIAALCVVAGACGWVLSYQFGGRSAQTAHDLLLSQRAERIASMILEERRYEKDLFINIDDHDRLESYARKWHEVRARLYDEIARAEKLTLSEQDRKALRDIEIDLRSYAWGYEKVLLMIRRGDIRTTQEANEEFARFKGAAHRIEAACAAMAERAQQRATPLT